jgi:hypothetical protein
MFYRHARPLGVLCNWQRVVPLLPYCHPLFLSIIDLHERRVVKAFLYSLHSLSINKSRTYGAYSACGLHHTTALAARKLCTSLIHCLFRTISYDNDYFGHGVCFLWSMKLILVWHRSQSWHKSQRYLTTDSQSASLSWCQATIRARDQLPFSLKFSLDSCGFVVLWLSLWREDGSVIYCCCLA